MWAFAAVVLCLVAFAAFWLRIEPLVRSLVELKVERERASRTLPQKSEPIPADLIAYAKSFSEEWAREQTLDRLYELYSQVGNWDNVRHAVTFDIPRSSVAQIEN